MDHFNAVRPLAVSVKDLSVSIVTPQPLLDKLRSKPPPTPFGALSHVTLDVAPGQVIAIMGASGSGKILFDNNPPKTFYENGSVGYVQQHDHLMPYLTVRESLRYCAELRLPGEMPIADKFQLVEEVILELGLKECADTIIGDDWRKGISGGEKRRVSVGCQLLLNPSVIFMDEPTTGLDSFTSFNLIETLVNLSRRGRTIFVSIHQPRSDIYKLFDSIIVLSKGRTVYAGQGGERAIEYFDQMGHPIPQAANPADAIIDICSIDNRDAIAEEKTRVAVNRLVTEWDALVAAGKHKQFEYSLRPEVEKIQRRSLDAAAQQPESSCIVMHATRVTDSNRGVTGSTRSLASNSKKPGAGFIAQCSILTRRAWKNLLRDNLSLWGNLIEVVTFGFLVGAVFFQLQETLPGVLSRRAALYITASIQTYLMLIFVIYKLCNDMKVFDRERADYMYGVVPYLFSQFTSQLPFNVLFPLVYSTFMYFMMGLRTDSLGIHYLRFGVANVLGQLIIFAYSQFCVSLARDFATASLIGNAMFTFFSFSTGFFIQLDSIPIYLRWISSISFLTYQYRLMASNEFSNKLYACNDIGTPCDGNSILQSLAISVDDYSIPIAGLICIFAVFIILAAIAMQLLTFDLNKHAGAVKSSVKVRKVGVHDEENGETSQAQLSPRQLQSVTVRIENIRMELVQKSVLGGQATQKTLLDDLNAEFPANSLTIIMGGSGTARRLRVGAFASIKTTGSVLFNGIAEANPARIASICSFVRQSDDHLLPALTCRETLYYSALLRLPAEWSRKQKEDHFVLDISSVDFRNAAAEERTKVQVDRIVAHWRQHEAARKASNPDVELGITSPTSGDQTTSPVIHLRRMAPFSTAFPVLAVRSFVNARRQPNIVIARILQVVFLGVIQALYFARQGTGQVSVQNRLGVLQQTISVLFIGLLNCVAAFPPERNILYYEHSDRTYSVEPFFLAYNLIEIPVEIVSAILYTIFTMAVVGLNTTVLNFVCMSFVVFLLVNIGESIGIAFCSLVQHVGFSVSLTNSVLGNNLPTRCTVKQPLVVSSSDPRLTNPVCNACALSLNSKNQTLGIFGIMSGILSSNMPVILDRINRISPIPYLARLMTINEFDSTTTFTCTQTEIASGTCIYHTGADVLRLLTSSDNIFTFDSSKFTLYITVGALLGLAYRLISFAVLKWAASKQ
eukprot:jgi/Hompol1/1663/HPOL_002739-RA